MSELVQVPTDWDTSQLLDNINKFEFLQIATQVCLVHCFNVAMLLLEP